MFNIQLNDIIPLLSIIITAWVTIFLYLTFAAKMVLRIIPRWVSPINVILRLEIENKAKVRVKPKRIRLQVLPYSKNKNSSLSEWVPFTREREIKGEESIEWSDPIDIFNSTSYLYPGEIIAIERLYCSDQPGSYFHVALQFETSILSRLIFFPKKIFSKENFDYLLLFDFNKINVNLKAICNESWTTTSIVYAPEIPNK